MSDFRLEFLSRAKRKHRSLMGLKTHMVQFGRGDMLFLEYVLAQMKVASSIVELGTYGGVTSMFLGLAARLREIQFHTFDIKDARIKEVRRAWFNDMMYFHKTDILSSKNEQVTNIINKPNTFLFVDNGNKEKEVNMYASSCGENTVMIIHDWGKEVKQENVEPELSNCGFEMYYEKLAQELNCICRCYIKKIL